MSTILHAYPEELFNSVHIWRYRSDFTASNQPWGPTRFISLDKAYELLSQDEKIRVKKFKVETAQAEYLFNRALLRLILAEYTFEKPNKIEFTYNQFGKPTLKNNQYGITFNLSHTNGYGVIAISLDYDLGVDVEEENHDFNYNDIVENFFSVSEARLIQNFADVRQKSYCFYELWTMKEALLKAAGLGLSYPMKDLDLSAIFNSSQKTMHLQNNFFELEKNYQICKIDMLDDRYHAFFAIENNGIDKPHIDYKNYQDIISESTAFKSYTI